jgi:hypothetical protein
LFWNKIYYLLGGRYPAGADGRSYGRDQEDGEQLPIQVKLSLQQPVRKLFLKAGDTGDAVVPAAELGKVILQILIQVELLVSCRFGQSCCYNCQSKESC